jgi:hypothetical protein
MRPVCPHCRQPFVPEPHNAWHQRYCSARACQRARNRESCWRWRRENPEHFKKDVQRSRDWRQVHPGYWRRERRKAFSADILMPVHRGAQNTLGVHIRDLAGFTLRHVVIAGNRDWHGVWRDVGLTLQNAVAGVRPWSYRGRRESERRVCF